MGHRTTQHQLYLAIPGSRESGGATIDFGRFKFLLVLCGSNLEDGYVKCKWLLLLSAYLILS